MDPRGAGDESLVPDRSRGEPPWVPVESRDLREVRYFADEGRLEIVFRNARKDGVNWYGYSPVGPGEYGELLTAPSKGTFFHASIKGRGDTPLGRR